MRYPPSPRRVKPKVCLSRMPEGSQVSYENVMRLQPEKRKLNFKEK